MDNQANSNPSQISNTPKKQNKIKTVILAVIFIILIGAVIALSFLLLDSNKSLESKNNELKAVSAELETAKRTVDKHEAVNSFIAEHNDESLSRSLCGGTPVGMFDVHLNDKFAVFRYLCSELDSAAPIRIGSLQKLQDGSYEFTYGSSSVDPNNLPSYIFDTDPEFFGDIYGAVRY